MTAPTRRAMLAGTGAAIWGASMPVPPQATVHPDAELLAACEEVLRMEADFGHKCIAADIISSDPRYGSPEHRKAEAEFYALANAQGDLMYAIADMPARTIEGMRAKARGLIAFYHGNVPESELPVGSLLASLLDDLTGGAA